jgi:hypothetical protein
MLDALQRSSFAQTIAQSQMITASLSALHVLGFAMVTSGALLLGLRALGRVFADRPAFDVVRPAARLLMLGACMNVMTGALLFSPRATSAVANGFFRTKMLLLVGAVIAQLVLMRGMRRRSRKGEPGFASVPGAAVSAALWIAVGVAGAAFILIE